MKKLLILLLSFSILLLCSCGRNEAKDREQHKTKQTTESSRIEHVTQSTTSTIPEDDKVIYIKNILNRYIEGVDYLAEKACVRVFGPVKLDGNFYKISVDTIPANKYGLCDSVMFYVQEDTGVEKSFHITFADDYNMQALRQFISLTIYATEPGISYEDAQIEMNKLIANYDNNEPSNVYVGSEYYVYITPTDVVDGYTVEAVYKQESNKKVNKDDYKELDRDAITSELNKGVSCCITAIPYEIEISYRYVCIKAKDLQGNPFCINGMFNNVLRNVEIGLQYDFYCVLSGKTINEEVYCGLRYYELSQSNSEIG